MAERKLARAAPRIAARLLLGLGATALTVPCLAQDFPLSRLVDDRTLAPDASGVLGAISDFALDPSGNLAFVADGQVFAFVGGALHIVSDPAAEVGNVEIDGGRVYWSEMEGEAGDAILAWEAGVGSLVVDEATPIPDTACTFQGGIDGFAEGWRRIGESIVFRGRSDAPGCKDVEGTYRWKDGVVEVLADRHTAFEERGTLRTCRFADLERDRVLLLCAAPGEGSWLYSVEGDGSVRTIAGPGAGLSPGGTVVSAALRNGVVALLARDAGYRPGTGEQFELYVRGGTSLAFSTPVVTSHGTPRNVIYRFDGRHVAVHASPWSSAKPFVLTFAQHEIDLGALGRPVLDATPGAFVDDWLPLTIAFADGSQALHAARPDGALARILGPGDVVEGRMVRAVRLGRATGRFVAVGVAFADGCVSCGGAWDAVYAAELEPAPVVIPLAEGARFTKLIDEHTLLPDGSPALHGLRQRGLSFDRSGDFAFAQGDRVLAGIRGEIREVGRLSEADRRADAWVNRVGIDAGHVFWSKEVSDDRGGGALYHWKDGVSTVVADEDTSIPETRCMFWGGADGVVDSWMLVGRGGVSVSAWSRSPYPECDDEILEGQYVWRNGTFEGVPPISPVVIEDGSVQLECPPWLVEGDRSVRSCAPLGSWQTHSYHLFEADGTHTRIVKLHDPVPGGSAPLQRVDGLELRGGRVAFIGYTHHGQAAVYAWNGTSLRMIADAETLGLDPEFAWSPSHLFFDGRRVAFLLGPQNFDIGPLLHFVSTDGPEARPIDLGVIDGHDGELDVAGLRHFVGDWLPFMASRHGFATRTVYAARADGSLFRILGPGDVLDGRVVRSATFEYASLAKGSLLSLQVSFSKPYCGWCGHPTDAIYAVRLPPTEVAIDVRPGSRRNRIHPGRRELVPVALLGSPDLDVADVNAARLAFGPDGAAPWRRRVARRDVNGDGFGDLVAHFRQRETGIARGDEEACLSGETTDGVAFEGCDVVRTPRPRASR